MYKIGAGSWVEIAATLTRRTTETAGRRKPSLSIPFRFEPSTVESVQVTIGFKNLSGAGPTKVSQNSTGSQIIAYEEIIT